MWRRSISDFVNRNSRVVSWLAVLAIEVCVFIGYGRVFSGFFQQDEWFGYGEHILRASGNLPEVVSFFFAPSWEHFQPFTLIVISGLFWAFGMSYEAFAWVSVMWHLVVVFLVYLLAREVFKDARLAVGVALIFGVLAASYQGTAWVVADIGTHGGTMMGVVSAIFFFKLLGMHKLKYAFYCMAFLFLSLLFKEIGVGLLVLYPLMFWLLGQGVRAKRKVMGIFLVCFLAYGVLRGVMVLAPQKPHTSTVFQYQSVVKMVYNLVTVPVKAISQSMLPERQMLGISDRVAGALRERVTGERGTPVYDVFLVKRVMELVSLTLSGLVIAASAFLYIRNRKDVFARWMVFGLAWVVINSFVFGFAPERLGVITVVDSRYLYFVSVGTAIFLVSLIFMVFQGKTKLVFLFIGGLALLNAYWLNGVLLVQAGQGRERREILEKIRSDYPKLPEKVIFYTESDRSYYGLPEGERILPFQSGLGQTLLAWYYVLEGFPRSFFGGRFLWEITDQGYKEADGRGFGYFRDFERMMQVVEEEKLVPEDVIAYRYDSVGKEVFDITSEVRGRVVGFWAKRKKLDARGWILTTDFNSDRKWLTIDGKRETIWDGEVPYATHQFFGVDLGRKVRVAEVVVDSYNNRDQNEVGYRVLVSGDGESWKEVFYAKRYPPSGDGRVEIYFGPSEARFLRLEQVGFHEYASWVIGEIEIYEAVD